MLTDAQRRDRAVTEADFQRMVTDLAGVLGWSYVHFRPAQTQRGWRTPVEGPLGAGWPDLVLLRVRDRRLIFAELKRETTQLTADQAAVLAALACLMFEYPEIPDDFPLTPQNTYLGGVFAGLDKALRDAPKVEVHLWRPSDLERIAEILR